MKQACFLLNLALAAGLFTVSADGATITWASGASGNWSNPTNWNPNQVPGSSDTAVITASGNYTVTVNTTVTVNGLVLGSSDTTTQTVLVNGGSLDIGQPATVNTNGVINMGSGELDFAPYGGSVVNGALTCSGGTLGGALTIASNGVANLIGISAGTQTIDFASLTLTNLGTIVWSNLNIECQSSSAIDNYGLWDIQTNDTFSGGSSGNSTVFNNYGTLRKDGGAWTVYQLSPLAVFDSTVNLNNSGTVDVETGGLSISTGSGSGLFNTATSAGLLLGNFTLTGNPTFTGAGQVQGNLYGYNTAIYGSLNLSAGTLAGALTVASNSVINLYWTGSTLPIGLEGLILTNYGTVIWGHFDLDCESGAQIYNYGLWDAQSDNTFYGNSGGGPFMSTFNNYGTVRKDGGSGITTFDSATTFNNSGTVDVETAQINIDMGSGGGFFNAATNTIVWLGIPDTFNLTSNATFAGPGSVGGNLYGYGNGVIHGSLNFYYGSLGGALTVASNAVANLTDILEGTQVVSQAVVFTSLTLTNYGTVAWNNVDLQCSSTLVCNYGLWDAGSDNTFYGDYLAPFISTFNNYGTVRKDGGSGITTFDSATTFNNYGTVDVETAQINIDMGSGGGLFNTASNAIVWLGIPNSFNLNGGTTFAGPGLVGGNLYGYTNGVIRGSLNFYYGSLSGALIVASNAVANLIGTVEPTQAITLNGLSLTNCGTVVWSNIDLDGTSTLVCNHGLWDALSDNTFYGDVLAPFISTFNNYGTVRKDGGSATTTYDGATTFNNYGKVDVQTGHVTVEGSCSLTNGTLNFGIRSPSQFGTIDFPNTVQLAGRLGANLRNHYTPAADNSFPAVVYGLGTGTFTSLCLPTLSSGLIWQTNYTSTTLTLSIVAAPPLQLSAKLSVSGNSMTLSWNGLSGQTYQVQCATNLAPANWVNLGDPITGTNGPVSVLDSINANPQKYYRIQSQ